MIPSIFRPGLSIAPRDPGADCGLWTARQLAVVAALAVMSAACFGGLVWFVVPALLRGVAWVLVVLAAWAGAL